MIDLTLTPEQEAQAQRVAAIIGQKAQQEALNMARIMASKPDAELLGAAEFEYVNDPTSLLLTPLKPL